MITVKANENLSKDISALNTVDILGFLTTSGKAHLEAMQLLARLVDDYGGRVDSRRWFITRVHNNENKLHSSARNVLYDMLDKYITFDKVED